MAKIKREKNMDMDVFLAEVEKHWPAVKGSLAEVRKPCIRPQCRACASGKKHPAFLLSFSQDGKRKCMYVPRDLVAVLQKAIANGRWLEKQLNHMGKQLIQEYRAGRKKNELSTSGERP